MADIFKTLQGSAYYEKTITLLLALSLILGLCACGKKPADKTPPTVAPTEAPTEAPTTASTEAPTTVATQAPTTKATKAPTTKATKAPTTAATKAPTTAPTAPVKTVIDSTYPIEISDQVYQNTLRCPALTANTPGAQEINKEIYNHYANALNDIEDGELGTWIYQYDYAYETHNGIVALLVDYTVGYVKGEYFPYCKAYYYDSNTGKQLTHDEYLSAMEVTELQLLSAFNASNEEDEYSYPRDYKITGAAIGKEDTKLIVYYENEIGDMFYITTVKTSSLK